MNILHPENRRLKIEDFTFADFYDLIFAAHRPLAHFVENKKPGNQRKSEHDDFLPRSSQPLS